MQSWINRTFRKLDFGGKFGFGCSGFSPFCFLFSLVRRGTRADTEIWFVIKQVIALWIPQVLTKLLLLFFFFFFSFDNSAHCLDIVWSKETLFFFFSFFLFYFLLFFFNLWLIDVFLFSFLFFSIDTHL